LLIPLFSRPFDDARFFSSPLRMLRRAAAALAGRTGRLAAASEAQVSKG
jgi:hypothetical protein